MLVVFTSNVHSDIIMFGDVAEKLIEMMGHSGTIPGAIAAKDVPDVLERLKKAIAFQQSEKTSCEQDNADEDVEEKVSLSGRAFPLIEMLGKAAEEDAEIMWYKK